MVAFNFLSKSSFKAANGSLPDSQTTVPLSPAVPTRRSFNLFRSRTVHDLQKPMLSSEKEHKLERRATLDFKSAALSRALSSRSDKRARESANIVRSLIIGPCSISPTSKKVQPVSMAQLEKVKSELAKPKSANKVIAHLRQLDHEAHCFPLSTDQPRTGGLIHAVCLDSSDEDAGKQHFPRLKADQNLNLEINDNGYHSVANATMESVASMFSGLQVISLISTDLGLGQPGDGEGILAGAVPTAETIIKGFETITPQLMALGFAVGKSIIPDHAGICPPADRLSVLTCNDLVSRRGCSSDEPTDWWGLEVVLPPASLKYLDDAQSISNAVLNFLTALALVSNGVREILPFIRYISQFIEFEFKSIKGQNRGQGVICTATWLMPAALVPRPWDFSPRPPALAQSTSGDGPVASELGSTATSDESVLMTPPAGDEPQLVMDSSISKPQLDVLSDTRVCLETAPSMMASC